MHFSRLSATTLCCSMMCSGAAVAGPQSHVDYPGLGQGAPTIAVVYAIPRETTQQAAVYVLRNDQWLLVLAGPYTRGSLLSGRGGKGNRYRMIDTSEQFSDLSFDDGSVMLTSGGGSKKLYPPGR